MLTAYVGEDATIRFDPREMGEIRVFYKDRFLCRAISAELAGETIPLRDVIRVRNQRRKELRSILHHRQKMVDTLLQVKQGLPWRKAMYPSQSPPAPLSASNATVTSDPAFVETVEYRRYFRCTVIGGQYDYR